MLGSGELVQTLIENDLVDEYFLTVVSPRFEFVVAIPEGTVTYEIRLEVVAPDDQVSDPVRYDIACDPDLPPGPDTLPPDVAPPEG